MDFNNELRSSELNYDFFDPYNVIHLIMSFLSRSTQESGFQTKKRTKKTINKSQKVKLK